MVQLVENKVNEKTIALQTLSHKVEPNQVLWFHIKEVIDINGNPLTSMILSSDRSLTDNPILTFIETENPDSKFYATVASNSGLLDRKAFPTKEYKGIAKQIDTSNGVNYEFVDTLVHDARGVEVTIKGANYTDMTVISIAENEIVYNTAFDYYEIKDMSKATFWEPGYATSSQTRKGELVAKKSNISYADYFKQIGFDIRAFETEKNGRIHIKSIDKMSKRVKQTASSSRPRTFFKGFKLEEIKEVPFDNMGEKEIARHLIFKKGHYDAEILIIPGFFVKQKVKSVLPKFDNNQIEIVDDEFYVTRDAVDGSHMVDREFALKHGMADDNDVLRSGEQFRWGQAIKGLMLVVPGLKDKLGVDIVLADGGIKGDPIPGFIEGNMDFAVLNRVREDELNSALNLSRQVTSYNQNEKLIKGLEKDTNALIDKVLDFDDSSIRDFLKIKDFDIESEEEINVDQLTTRLYSTGQNVFMKSHTMKKKLSDLLRSSLQRFSNGSSLYLKEASYKHMVVDPYAIVHYLAEGILGINKEEISDIDKLGIAPNHVVTSEKVMIDGIESFQLNTKKGYAFRFPFLHSHEGRILNLDDNIFIDLDTKEFYEWYVKKGHAQGLIFYSLWDMEPESQGGADFDGDYTGYTTNPHIVDNIEVQPSFLDYSIVNNKLESGCPFTGEGKDLHVFLDEKDIEFIKDNDITIEGGGVSAPAELSNTDDWINLIGKLGSYLARHTLEGNEIGRFTNISLSICQIISELENRIDYYSQNEELKDVISSLKTEKEGYERLNYFLAIAIRWEVDKAKHGGAYFNKMPFLYALIDIPEIQDVINLEKTYNISLQRLLYGSKLK